MPFIVPTCRTLCGVAHLEWVPNAFWLLTCMSGGSSAASATLSGFVYSVLVLATTACVGLSCAALLSQAVRNSTEQSWEANWDAVVVGASYAIVAAASLGFCLKRRISVHRRLQRITKSHHILGKSDVPKPVFRHIQQEYARACLVRYESLPKDESQEGWAPPGSKDSEMRFRTLLLRTVRDIDKLAHDVIPRHPTLRPHDRVLHHFRFIQPLLPRDEDDLTPLHYYDSAIQLARHASREPTEAEFDIGMRAAYNISRVLKECRMEMLQGSNATLDSIVTEPKPT